MYYIYIKDKKRGQNELKNIIKAILKTILVYLISVNFIYGAISIFKNDMTAEESYFLAVISILIGIIFTIFYCTQLIEINLSFISNRIIYKNRFER